MVRNERTNRLNFIVSRGIVVLGICACLIVMGCSTKNESNTKSRVKEGNPIPDINLKSLNNIDVKLSEFKGNIIILYAWTMSLGRTHLPPLIKYNKDMNGKPIKIISVHLDYEEGKTTLAPEIINFFKTRGGLEQTLNDSFRWACQDEQLNIIEKTIAYKAMSETEKYDKRINILDECEQSFKQQKKYVKKMMNQINVSDIIDMTYTDPCNSFIKTFGITSDPTTFIINKNGILVKKHLGPLNFNSPETISFLDELMR